MSPAPNGFASAAPPPIATVVVDGLDQSEVWSAFRVAAAPSRSITDQARTSVEASHDGYRRLPDPVTHKRALRSSSSGGLLVTHQPRRPGASHAVTCTSIFIREARPEFRPDSRLTARERPGTYHPEFNCSVPNRVLIRPLPGRAARHLVTIS